MKQKKQKPVIILSDEDEENNDSQNTNSTLFMKDFSNEQKPSWYLSSSSSSSSTSTSTSPLSSSKQSRRISKRTRMKKDRLYDPLILHQMDIEKSYIICNDHNTLPLLIDPIRNSYDINSNSCISQDNSNDGINVSQKSFPSTAPPHTSTHLLLSPPSNDFLLWTEKYRPSSIEQLIIHPKKLESLRSWLIASNPSSPILIVTGPCGSGKYTSLILLCESLHIDLIQMNCLDDINQYLSLFSSQSLSRSNMSSSFSSSSSKSQYCSSFETYMNDGDEEQNVFQSLTFPFSVNNMKFPLRSSFLGLHISQCSQFPSLSLEPISSSISTDENINITTLWNIDDLSSSSDSPKYVREKKASKIILLRDIDIPLQTKEYRNTFAHILEQYLLKYQKISFNSNETITKLIIIWTDNNGLSMNEYHECFPKKLLDHIQKIQFNPLPRTSLYKILDNILRQEKLFTWELGQRQSKKRKHFDLNTSSQEKNSDMIYFLDRLISIGHGDIRSTINALQWITLISPLNNQGSTFYSFSEVAYKNFQFELISILGNVLYKKMTKYSFSELVDHVSSSGADQEYFIMLLHQFYLSHLSDRDSELNGLEECKIIAEYFSDTLDLLGDSFFHFGHSVQSAYAKLILEWCSLLPARALMLRKSYSIPSPSNSSDTSTEFSVSTRTPELVIHRRKWSERQAKLKSSYSQTTYHYHLDYPKFYFNHSFDNFNGIV